MQPVPTPDNSDIYLTIHWKDRPDEREPWWVHWYYDHVYVPFLRFSFKRFRIPRAKQASVEADKDGNTRTTFSWFENGGAFPTPQQADLACVDEFDGYKPIPYNRCAPRDSAEYGPVVFPRAGKPKRWSKPTMSLVVKDRKEDDQIKQELKRLHQVLDR